MYDFLGIRLSLFALIGNKTVLLLTTYPASCFLLRIFPISWVFIPERMAIINVVLFVIVDFESLSVLIKVCSLVSSVMPQSSSYRGREPFEVLLRISLCRR